MSGRPASPQPAPAALLILAGGRSSRMGVPKADLPAAGTTLLGLLLARLGPEFTEVLVAGRGAFTGLEARIVSDRFPDAGPLAGLEAGLAAATQASVVVVACDLPLVPAKLARLLLSELGGHDAAVPVVRSRLQPLCAAYRADVHSLLRRRLEAGRRRLTDALAEMDVRRLSESELGAAGVEPSAFENLNTPLDYARFLARAAALQC